jgi:hypothetical protein
VRRKGFILALALLCAAPVFAADIFINADITTSQTWTADNTYILQLPVYVTGGSTLTIEAGTVVRGEPTGGANDPGTLIITRGSKLRALGTKLKPVTFTDLDDDNVGNNNDGLGPTDPYDTVAHSRTVTGQWGGVILLGHGYIANGTAAAVDPAKEFQIEGLTNIAEKGFYGGCSEFLTGPFGRNCDDGDSGTLNYISIRYGGFNLSANNEINGLTLGGVGRETELDYIEVLNNKDDGVEFFGGAANIKHLVAISGGDDGLDYDEGWRGKAQFVFIAQGTPGTDKSDKAFEQDGGTVADASLPFAIPTLSNITAIGLGQKNYTAKLTNTALHFRDNAGGRQYNSTYLDFGGAAALIEGGTPATGDVAAGSSGQRSITPYAVDGVYHLGPAGGNQLELEDNVFYCFGAPTADLVPTGRCSVTTATVCGSNAGCPGGETCVDQAPTYGGDTGKIHRDNGAFTNAALDNTYIACGGALPIQSLVREVVADATKPDPIAVVNPLPAVGSPLLTTNRALPNDGFFELAPYKGAFGGTTRSDNWADGWTGASRLGYFGPITQVTISADITTSDRWTADHEYVLTQPIYVTGGSTLTIEPGTVVRGEPTGGANDPGTLIITRGSKLNAAGTKANPIVFTDLNDDNVRGFPGIDPYDSVAGSRTVTGQWGGVILLGHGYIANGTAAAVDPAKEFQIEGLTNIAEKGFYGGCSEFLTGPFGRNCDDGDSGTLNYISIRYGGFNLSANNEINGLTLGGVGRETDLDFIEVMNNKDDGVEFFGGAANIKHLAAASGGDDGLDYDEGWRGKAQFVFILQGTPGTDKSDKGFEQDGGTVADASLPFAIPTLSNVTAIGLGQKNYTAKLTNTALHFRDNAGGRQYNSTYLDFGGAAALIEGGTPATGDVATGSSGQRSVTPYAVDGVYHLGPAGGNQLELEDNVFYCFGAPTADLVPTGRCSVTTATVCGSNAGCPGGETCVDQAPTYGGDTGKIHRDNGAFTNAALDNTYIACGGALPITELTREIVADPTKPDPPLVIDPRPAAGGALNATNRKAPNDGFFEFADYKGAFAPGHYWMKRWSSLDRVGYLRGCINGVGAKPDEVDGLRFVDKTNLVWTRFANGAAAYDLIRSGTPSDFTGATCVETDGSDGDKFDPDTPGSGAAFYYLVRATNACGDATLGRRSNGVERVGASCP